MDIDSKMATAALVLCVLWGSIALGAQYTNLVHNGVHAGEESRGAQNVALGAWAFYQGAARTLFPSAIPPDTGLKDL